MEGNGNRKIKAEIKSKGNFRKLKKTIIQVITLQFYILAQQVSLKNKIEPQNPVILKNKKII